MPERAAAPVVVHRVCRRQVPWFGLVPLALHLLPQAHLHGPPSPTSSHSRSARPVVSAARNAPQASMTSRRRSSNVAASVALLHLAPGRVGKGLFRHLPVDPLVRAPRPERAAEAVRAAIDPEVVQQPAEHRRPGHLPLDAGEDEPSTSATQPVRPLKDHKGGAGEGNPVLLARLHARGGNGPRRRLQVDLAPPCSPHLAAARRRQRQETQRQPRPDPCAGRLYLDQRLAQLLDRQAAMVLPLSSDRPATPPTECSSDRRPDSRPPRSIP